MFIANGEVLTVRVSWPSKLCEELGWNIGIIYLVADGTVVARDVRGPECYACGEYNNFM